MTYIVTFCYNILVNQIWRTAQQDGEQEEKMDWYEKLFLFALLGIGIAGVAVNIMTIVNIHNALG